jgi:hypothetical protein
MTKTTVELPEALLIEAKALAVRERTTLRALVERGLRAVVSGGSTPQTFRLRDGSVPGNGLQPEFRDAGWERIRDAIYEYDRS